MGFQVLPSSFQVLIFMISLLVPRLDAPKANPKNHENHAEEATKTAVTKTTVKNGKPAKGEEMEPQLGNRTRFWNAFFAANLWPVEVVVFYPDDFFAALFLTIRVFDPVTALESVISLRFRALLGFAKVCPLSGPATCHVLWCFWLLELRHPCPFGQDNNICHGYPMCFAQAEVGNTARKRTDIFYWFLIGESCWFWLILLILMSCMGCEKSIINIGCLLLLKQMYVQNH